MSTKKLLARCKLWVAVYVDNNGWRESNEINYQWSRDDRCMASVEWKEMFLAYRHVWTIFLTYGFW